MRLTGFPDREIRGVIFDLDGVIAPTLPNHVRAYAEVLKPLGVAVTYEDVAYREGQRSPEIIAWLARERGGLELPPEEVKRLSELKNETYRGYDVPPPYDGADRLLDALHGAGLRVGLASGTHHKNVPHVLGPLHARFDAVVAAEDVTRPKPDAEPYVKAAGKLGIDAREALVIENAPLGVRSGKASGAVVVAVTSTLPADALKEADRIVPSLADVLPLVEPIR